MVIVVGNTEEKSQTHLHYFVIGIVIENKLYLVKKLQLHHGHEIGKIHLVYITMFSNPKVNCK